MNKIKQRLRDALKSRSEIEVEQLKKLLENPQAWLLKEIPYGQSDKSDLFNIVAATMCGSDKQWKEAVNYIRHVGKKDKNEQECEELVQMLELKRLRHLIFEMCAEQPSDEALDWINKVPNELRSEKHAIPVLEHMEAPEHIIDQLFPFRNWSDDKRELLKETLFEKVYSVPDPKSLLSPQERQAHLEIEHM